MRPRSLLYAILAAGLVWLLLVSAPVQAHPHAWIDLEITLERDGEGRITHMLHRWRFDPTYGQYLYEDALAHQEGATEEEKLQALAREILGNLEEYEWYSHVEAGGRAVDVAAEPDPSMRMEDGLLFFRFRLALDEPVDVGSETLAYKVYDPTYFIELLHEEPAGTRIVEADGLAAAGCSAELERPRPDPQLVAKAMMLDYGATVDYDLGRHFAERVTVRCD
ncbi:MULTISPECIES: DUF1007 family protein [unclassified Thioalkalivibrio]|uniref:DUF1007 family protein n=1 Tax=unclassified Thioalkalivibrio TaxID=2621013 RepID=UPI00037ED3AF|nr:MULTISPECIES: DUF1007 family protein [unclassified Thioalkalivibrio]